MRNPLAVIALLSLTACANTGCDERIVPRVKANTSASRHRIQQVKILFDNVGPQSSPIQSVRIHCGGIINPTIHIKEIVVASSNLKNVQVCIGPQPVDDDATALARAVCGTVGDVEFTFGKNTFPIYHIMGHYRHVETVFEKNSKEGCWMVYAQVYNPSTQYGDVAIQLTVEVEKLF